MRKTEDYFMNKVALFTTNTENNVLNIIISYQTYKNKNKFFNFYVLGNSFSEENIKFLKKYNIDYIDVDLYDTYKIESNWPYPSECFWLFYGPLIFNDLGYKHSMYVDFDVLCNKEIPYDVFNDISVISGAVRSKNTTCYDFLRKISTKKDFQKINDTFELKNKNILSINSGVLLFNNENYVLNKIFEKSVEIFKISKINNIERKGDDSLLSLMMLTLDEKYFNCLNGHWNNYDFILDIENSYLIHSSRNKPWSSKNLNTKEDIYIKNMWTEVKEMVMNRNMNLFWYRGNEYNFGDEITPWLFKKMFKYEQVNPINIRKSKLPVLLAVGSIMRLSCDKTEIWGSGIRNIDQKDFTKSKKYHAVRGLFSRSQLLNLGYECPEVYGDPGLLLPKYYNPTNITKKFKLGIIPHIVDYVELKNKFKDNPEITIINLKTNNIEKIVNQILECENTISTSLHGIITSVAYKVPTRWLKFSNKINGDDIKFYDFFTSLDKNVFFKFDRFNFKSHDNKYNPIVFKNETIIDGNKMRDLNLKNIIKTTVQYDTTDFNEEKLIDSCPFKINNS